MLKWIDLIELMGYVTALFSVSVSYASKIQEEQYSDFLMQNQSLRNSLLSPFFSRIIMLLIGVYLIYFLGQYLLKKRKLLKEKRFSAMYVVFLGGVSELLLWYLYKLTFVGAPMLIVGLLMIFSVEISRVYKEDES